jgi:hypothetical protein
VIRRHVLAALAAGIDAGNEDVARREVRKIEWLLRGKARRRLEGALMDGALLSNELASAIDLEAARHVQRVAALTVARAKCADYRDRQHVAQAYATLPKARARRFPLLTVVLGLVLTFGVTGGVFYVHSLPGPAPREYVRPLPTPVAGAYASGGVPLRDEPLEKLFTGELTKLVVATDQDRRNGGLDKGRKAMADALLAPPVIVAKGATLAAAWKSMIEMVDRWTTLPYSDNDFDKLAKDLRLRVRAVSDQLAAAGLGYYLEADMFVGGGTAHLAIYTYRVEEVVFVKAGNTPRRVLSLRRLDNINLRHALLGMQSDELGDPVLLLDEIDAHVVTQVLPVLAPDASYDLADDEWVATEPGRSLAALAGTTVRTELLAALGNDAAAATEIGKLLQKRNEIIAEWERTLHARGWVMPAVTELFVQGTLLDSLDGQVPDSQIRKVRDLDEEIAKADAARIASRCHQLVAASVRRHEAQHGLDADRETPQRYPAPLEDLLGPANADDGTPRSSVEHARGELSAYLSQLANDTVTPQFTLWNVARFAFDDRQWGTPESYAGALIVEGLAQHLGIATDGPVIHDHEIDRDRLATLIRPMAALPGDRLRAAARELWKDFYSEDLVPIVDR